MTEQIRMAKLLSGYDMYRRWFIKPPLLPTQAIIPTTFVVYVQREASGPWSRTIQPFKTYARAVNFARPRMKGWHDWTVNCPSRYYPPPMTKEKIGNHVERVRLEIPPGHRWCGYCRRPTVFAWFLKHHALPAKLQCVAASDKRCTICGAGEGFVKRGRR